MTDHNDHLRSGSAPRTWLWLPRFLTSAAIALVPWIGLLIVEPRGRASHRSLESAWIELDIAEACALLMLAHLMRHGHGAVSAVAAVAATLLATDAWFDLMSSGHVWTTRNFCCSPASPSYHRLRHQHGSRPELRKGLCDYGPPAPMIIAASWCTPRSSSFAAATARARSLTPECW